MRTVKCRWLINFALYLEQTGLSTVITWFPGPLHDNCAEGAVADVIEGENLHLVLHPLLQASQDGRVHVDAVVQGYHMPVGCQGLLTAVVDSISPGLTIPVCLTQWL